MSSSYPRVGKEIITLCSYVQVRQKKGKIASAAWAVGWACAIVRADLVAARRVPSRIAVSRVERIVEDQVFASRHAADYHARLPPRANPPTSIAICNLSSIYENQIVTDHSG